MNPTRLEKIYAGTLVVILGLIVLHAPISVGFGTLFPDFELLIKSWKELLMILALPIGLYIVTKRQLWPTFLRDPLFYVLTGYVALHLALAGLLYQGAQSTLAGMAIDLRFVLFFALVYMLLAAVPMYRRLLLQVVLAGVCIVVGFGALQLFLPADILTHIGYSKNTIEPYLTVDKNAEYIRINSTLRGPNPLGAYVGIVLALVAAAWTKGKVLTRQYQVAAALLAILGCIVLWVTYSRSALIAATIGVVVVLGLTVGRKLSRQVWIGIVVVALAVGGTFVAVRDTPLVSNVILHENPNGGSEVTSNEQHAESLAVGFERMVRQPLGAGVGSTGSASLYGDDPIVIENQYLFIAHETGWLGLGLFLALFIGALVRLWKARNDWLSLAVLVSGIGLGLIGILQPVWADDTVSMIWWALAAIALTGGAYARPTTKQKAA